MKKILGLTGGIGSGKSTVARMLMRLGACVVDADEISRASTAAAGSAIEPIRQAFGADMINHAGALDRAKMRELVFADPQAKQRLEAITHPLIRQEMQAQIDAASASWVVLDLPLLAEPSSMAGFKPKLARIWVVDCPQQVQIERVMARSGLTAAQVRSIIDAQASRELRRCIADTVIYNHELKLHALERLVQDAFTKLQ